MFRYKATAGGAMNHSVTPDAAGEIDSVRLTLNAAVGATENLTISIVSAIGSEYNVTLNVQAMNALSYYVWQPTRPHPFFAGDAIKVVWANSNAVIWGLEILWAK